MSYIAGLYVDDRQCAVFLFPCKWDGDGLDTEWVLHGTLAERAEGIERLDWYGTGVRDGVSDNVLLKVDGLGNTEQSSDCWRASFADERLVWSDGGSTRFVRGKSTWLRVRVLSSQIAACRRPFYPSICFIFFLWRSIVYVFRTILTVGTHSRAVLGARFGKRM